MVKIRLTTILTVTEVIGLGVTAYLSAKAGVRAHRNCVIEKYKKNCGENDVEKIVPLTKKEAFQASWKEFVLPVAVGTVTAGAIIFSEIHHVKAEKGLAAAAAMSGAILQRYEQAVLNNTEEAIAQEIREEVISGLTGDMMAGLSDDIHNSYSSNKMRCYCPYCDEIFYATQVELLNAEIEINRTLVNGGGTSLCQYMKMFGVDIPEDGVGWWMDDTYNWEGSFFGFHNGLIPQIEESGGQETLVCYWSHEPCETEEDFLCP